MRQASRSILAFCWRITQWLKDAKEVKVMAVCLSVKRWQTNDRLREGRRQVMASAGLRGAVKLSVRLSQPESFAHSCLKSLISLSLSSGFRKWMMELLLKPQTCKNVRAGAATLHEDSGVKNSLTCFVISVFSFWDNTRGALQDSQIKKTPFVSHTVCYAAPELSCWLKQAILAQISLRSLFKSHISSD